MTILVTGYNGFIGRHLCKKLAKLGHRLIGIDNYSTSEFSEDWILECLAKYIRFDITAPPGDYDDLINRIGKVDVIIHLAALARVQPSFENPVKWHETNVVGTLKLIDLAKRVDCKKFIFASSSSVYGGILGWDTEQCEYREDASDSVFPTSPYALQKLTAENYLFMLSNTFKAIALRLFNVYGENQPTKGQYPQAIPIWRDQFKDGDPITLYGNGNTSRDFTHVDDVTDAFVACLKDDFSSEIFDIGTGESYTMRKIINAITGDRNYPIQKLPARNEPNKTLAQNQKAKDILGWKPKINVIKWLEAHSVKE